MPLGPRSEFYDGRALKHKRERQINRTFEAKNHVPLWVKIPHPGLLPDDENWKCGTAKYCAEFLVSATTARSICEWVVALVIGDTPGHSGSPNVKINWWIQILQWDNAKRKLLMGNPYVGFAAIFYAMTTITINTTWLQIEQFKR